MTETNPFGGFSIAMVEDAMRRAHCWELRERLAQTLSGGERQRGVYLSSDALGHVERDVRGVDGDATARERRAAVVQAAGERQVSAVQRAGDALHVDATRPEHERAGQSGEPDSRVGQLNFAVREGQCALSHGRRRRAAK